MLERGEVDRWHNGPYILDRERSFRGNAIGGEKFVYRGSKENAMNEKFKRYRLF